MADIGESKVLYYMSIPACPVIMFRLVLGVSVLHNYFECNVGWYG